MVDCASRLEETLSAPLRIRLDEDRRRNLADAIRRFADGELGIELSGFQVGRLIDFLVTELGAPVYNQAIQDARGFFEEKLADLEGEFYEPEDGG